MLYLGDFIGLFSKEKYSACRFLLKKTTPRLGVSFFWFLSALLCFLFIQGALLIFGMQQMVRLFTAGFTQIILIQLLNGFIFVR